MRPWCLRVLGLVMACLIGMAAALVVGSAQATASPGVLVYPGMEIRQGTALCTLGFVDVAARIGFTAGHCRATDTVTDPDGNVIGHSTIYRDDTPNGATITTDHLISDWEQIALSPDVAVNDILPGGRALSIDPAVVPQHGQHVCHFGVVTKESCGTVEAVNNGWFTMTNGVVSQRGDSGGPVYVLTDDGRAVIVGMFNSTWGQFPAAVSWQSANRQIRDEVVRLASASAAPAPTPPPGVPPPA